MLLKISEYKGFTFYQAVNIKELYIHVDAMQQCLFRAKEEEKRRSGKLVIIE
jgi:hypothetical protein